MRGTAFNRNQKCKREKGFVYTWLEMRSRCVWMPSHNSLLIYLPGNGSRVPRITVRTLLLPSYIAQNNLSMGTAKISFFDRKTSSGTLDRISLKTYGPLSVGLTRAHSTRQEGVGDSERPKIVRLSVISTVNSYSLFIEKS